MKFIQLYVYFQLFTIVNTLLYPCQYIDASESVLKCDLCRCLSSPAIRFTTDLCSLTTPLTCPNNYNEQLLRSKVNELTSTSVSYEKQIEFHNFNQDIQNYEQLCSINNYSQVTFFNLLFNFSSTQLSNCFIKTSTSRFVNSFIQSPYYLSENLIFYNSTFDIKNLHLISTKSLVLHSIEFLHRPFELNSVSSLIHLTIIHTEHFTLHGLFPHLSYLNLASTRLNDKQLGRIFSQINTPDLTTMILSNNQLTLITNKFPSTIRYLDLSKNQIKSLDYYSFKSLYSLNILNLSYNAQLEIQQDTFTRIPYLEVLDLSYCSPTLSFDDLFMPLQKLRHLNISANYLDSFPHLPTPYDAHSVESYDQHLPVLYVDLSRNNFEKFDFEMFSTPSAQDKYILSINMNDNRLKTLKFPAQLLNDTKRRGPFIELDLLNNPLECDCNLYETIVTLFQNNASPQKQSVLISTDLQQMLSPGFYLSNARLQNRRRRQYSIVPRASSVVIASKQNRIKFLHLSNLTCMDVNHHSNVRSLLNLNSSNSFCPYAKYCPSTCLCCSSLTVQNSCDCYISCPVECSCKQSFDRTNNYVNCSNRQLMQIPVNIPYSTTHLLLNNNLLSSIDKTLTYLTNLKYLSLANNDLQILTSDEFPTMNKLEHLDLSSNRIETIAKTTFSSMAKLKTLLLHNNLWIPKFYESTQEFQSNTRLDLLTYAKGLSCDRSTISASFSIEKPLTAQDCCLFSNSESCQAPILNIISSNRDYNMNTTSLKNISTIGFHLRYFLLSFVLLLFMLTCFLVLCLYRKKRLLLFKQKYLSNGVIKTEINQCHIKGTKSHTQYNHQANDNSLSFTDEDDDYASIPLTLSQTDLNNSSMHFQVIVPPLPPPRQLGVARPISHSSTISTSVTNPSTKTQNSSSTATTHSCLQIKLDALVLYSIHDSKFIHDTIGQQVEKLYGQRFSFYFIHRDRMLGELDWLIENSCVTILILRKPYHLVHDYMKVLSTRPMLKCFIILINNDENHRITSIKAREKIARLYQTSDIYEWNSNPNSLVHEQLELFLEQYCGSSSYVTD